VYFNGAVQVSLTAADNLSGVANIFYRIDSGTTQNYTTPFSVSGDGTHAVNFWSVDVAGNNTNSYTSMIRIDATAPVTQATASGTTGTSGWYRGPVQISLVASDNLSGLKTRFYRLNSGAVQTYVSAFTISALGTHTITFWSVDQANNTESAKPLVVKIDSSVPVITANASPTSSPKKSSPVNVTISGRITDTPSGVKPNSAFYSVVDEYGVTQPSGSVALQSDGTYSFRLTLPATRKNNDSDGHKYTITIQASDQAGNTGTASTIFKIL
jgi:hypothetical protein